MKIGSGKKGLFFRPLTILIFYLNIGHANSRFYELEDIHNGRLKKKQNFRPEIFTPFYTPLRSKRALISDIQIQGSMSLKIYTMADLKKNFRSEISTPFYTLLKSKKGLNLRFFRKRTHNLSFLTKIKTFFCLNCITLVNNVTQRIFDKRFCCLYISVFVLVKSIF